MKLHQAIVKFPAKECWEYVDGQYGPQLQAQVTLCSGEDATIYENDPECQAFLGLKTGDKVQILETDTKPKYILATTPTAERIEHLLDCFEEILLRVEARFPNRSSEDHREIASTILNQLQLDKAF